MRIISGKLRGKKLHSIQGIAIRPTSDRIRESVFNILSSAVRDAMVLDLFAGTGALGIEALSRGAKFGVFVDFHKSAISVITRNLNSCGLEQQANVIRWDVRRNLGCLRSRQSFFDLVFMDPPYDKNLIMPALSHLHHSGSLRKGAVIVAEHSISEKISEPAEGFILRDQRKYGKTLVSFLNYMV